MRTHSFKPAARDGRIVLSKFSKLKPILEKQQYEYRVVIRFARSTKSQDIASGKLSVTEERLKVSGETAFELANGEIHFFPNSGAQARTVPLETTKSALHLSQLSNSHVRRFVEWIDSVHCFRIDEYPDAMEESADREEGEPGYELQNLAGWYRYLLQAYPKENVAFTNAMEEALTGFQTLRFSPNEYGRVRLWADFSGPKQAEVNYALPELSEGQRCLLALYMILHFLIARGHTVFIDEPDNFIALREIQPWLLAAERAVEDHNGQLILISHHPELLNQWASSHGLRFFREDNGFVRTEKFRTDPRGSGGRYGSKWLSHRRIVLGHTHRIQRHLCGCAELCRHCDQRGWLRHQRASHLDRYSGPYPARHHLPRRSGADQHPGCNRQFQRHGLWRGALCVSMADQRVNLADGGAFSGSQTSVLTIASISVADGLSYDVIITNSYGSVTSAVATLTVIVPPSISSQPSSVTNNQDATVMFSAAVGGSLPLSYRWYDGATPIQ